MQAAPTPTSPANSSPSSAANGDGRPRQQHRPADEVGGRLPGQQRRVGRQPAGAGAAVGIGAHQPGRAGGQLGGLQGGFLAGGGGRQRNQAQRKAGLLRGGRYEGRRGIGGVVVGNQDFEAGGGQGLGGEVVQELREGFGFVAGGDEDRELRHVLTGHLTP